MTGDPQPPAALLAKQQGKLEQVYRKLVSMTTASDSDSRWDAFVRRRRLRRMALAGNHSKQIVQKLWNYCNELRDNRLSYGDFLEQLTYLLFLKMAHEQTQPPYDRASTVPEEYAWSSLLSRDGDELETHYRHVLESLATQPGMLGVIFRKSQNKIQDPAKLRRLIVD